MVLPWSKLSDSVHLFLVFYAIPLLRRESRVRFVLWTVRSWLWKSQQRTRLGEIQGISEFRIYWIQILDSSVGRCLKWSTPSKNWVAIEQTKREPWTSQVLRTSSASPCNSDLTSSESEAPWEFSCWIFRQILSSRQTVTAFTLTSRNVKLILQQLITPVWISCIYYFIHYI